MITNENVLWGASQQPYPLASLVVPIKVQSSPTMSRLRGRP